MIYMVLFYSVTGAKKPRDSASPAKYPGPGWAGSLSFLEGDPNVSPPQTALEAAHISQIQ